MLPLPAVRHTLITGSDSYTATDGTLSPLSPLYPCYFPAGIRSYSDDSRDDFPRNHLCPQASDKIKPDI